MSASSRDRANDAKEKLNVSRKFSRAAEKIFKEIGDREGEKKSGAAADAADDAYIHVTKKLGGDVLKDT